MKRAKLIIVDKNIIDFDNNIDFESINQSEKLKIFLEENDCKKGDIVHFEQYLDYKNKGKLIYNGKNLVELDYNVDKSGAIPKQFEVIKEFPCNHWINVIDNTIVWYFSAKNISMKNIIFNEKFAIIIFDKYQIRIIFDECDNIVKELVEIYEEEIMDAMEKGLFYASNPFSDDVIAYSNIIWLKIEI